MNTAIYCKLCDRRVDDNTGRKHYGLSVWVTSPSIGVTSGKICDMCGDKLNGGYPVAPAYS